VPFFVDTRAPGCVWSTEGAVQRLRYGCQRTADNEDNSRCAADLQLTITAGAYYADRAEALRSEGAAEAAEMFGPPPVRGPAVATRTLDFRGTDSPRR
jgi:hypothetical protein